MVESRWLRSIGPGVIALGAVALLASTTHGGGDRPFAPNPCGGARADLVGAARDPGAPTMAGLRNEPWFRVDPLLDRDGALRGQRLVTGLAGGRAPDAAELVSESFAAGPHGRIVLVGSDDGTTSRLVAFDVAGACAWTITEERDVIRRATIDRSGTRLYETRVDRATRADLGVWLRPLDGGPARRVLPPLAPDTRYGRTFSTEFAWDVDGDRLAVQSCGEVACRTRVVEPVGGSPVTVDDPDLGTLVGLVGDLVVSYGACRGMPCPIVSTDLVTGERHVLVPDGGPAMVTTTPDGARLIHEVRAGPGRTLRSTALDGSSSTDLGPIPDDLGLLGPVTVAAAAIRLPDGWVLLGPDGRLPTERTSAVPQLRHIPDGTAVMLDEATR